MELLAKFAIFTLFFKYLTENFLYDVVSFAIDIILQRTSHWNLTMSVEQVQLILIIFSALILAAKLIFTFIVIFGWKWKSELIYLYDGIKLKVMFFIIYFTHYFIIWFLLALLIGLTGTVNKIALVSLLFFFQFMSFGVNILNLFSWKVLHF